MHFAAALTISMATSEARHFHAIGTSHEKLRAEQANIGRICFFPFRYTWSMDACRLLDMPNGGSQCRTREVLPSPPRATPPTPLALVLGGLPRIAQNYGGQEYLHIQSPSEVSENSKSGWTWDEHGQRFAWDTRTAKHRQKTTQRPSIGPKIRLSVLLEWLRDTRGLDVEA